MKQSIFTFILLITNVFCSFAQKGYFYNGNFIELIPEDNEAIALYGNNENQIASPDYASFSYHTKDKHTVYINPTIIIELKDSVYIRNIRRF